jgi:hypothetical protein
MNTCEYLDQAKKAKNLASDNQLALALGWGRQKISNYRSGKQHMNNEAARVFAGFIKVPVIKIIADMEAQRTHDEISRRAWSKLSKTSKKQVYSEWFQYRDNLKVKYLGSKKHLV